MPSKKSHKTFIREMQEKNKSIIILGKYINAQTKIECMCSIHNYKWQALPSNLLNGRGCPVCSNKVVVEGINDVATTHPELLVYFKNKEEAKYITCGSGKKIACTCPNCKSLKMLPMHELTYGHFKCQKCSDGISYPNKFARSFLSQLQLQNIEYEWQPHWAKPYFYDNYFEYDGKKYILEMDGGFHYEAIGFNDEKSLNQRIKLDKEKDKLAIEHNIELIRIDCRKSYKEYIKNNILNSKLNNIFNLSSIDWDICDKDATKSMVVSVCNMYNSSNLLPKDIAKYFYLNPSTVQRYLHIGTNLGICHYHPLKHSKTKIVVLNSNREKIYEFNCIGDCSRFLSEKYCDNYATTYY